MYKNVFYVLKLCLCKGLNYSNKNLVEILEQLICVGMYTLTSCKAPWELLVQCILHLYCTINDNKFACKFFWNMNVRVPVLHRFDIIGLGPDSPEDEEGIKASSEICKLSCIFKSEGFVERYWSKKKYNLI